MVPRERGCTASPVTIFKLLQVCVKSPGGVKDLGVGNICSRETHTLGNKTSMALRTGQASRKDVVCNDLKREGKGRILWGGWSPMEAGNPGKFLYWEGLMRELLQQGEGFV